MSVHIEWFHAPGTGVEVIGPGTELGEGAVSDHKHALVLGSSGESLAVFEGTLPQLRALAVRITTWLDSVGA